MIHDLGKMTSISGLPLEFTLPAGDTLKLTFEFAENSSAASLGVGLAVVGGKSELPAFKDKNYDGSGLKLDGKIEVLSGDAAGVAALDYDGPKIFYWKLFDVKLAGCVVEFNMTNTGRKTITNALVFDGMV